MSNVAKPATVVGSQFPAASPRASLKGLEIFADPKTPHLALLTAGRDKPYALGLASALIAKNLCFEFIGSDIVNAPELHGNNQVTYLNLRDQQSNAGAFEKVRRVLVYYCRLLGYAATARPEIFHILWNNKFELFDRTLLMGYYKLLKKKVVITAHNVNAGARDGNDSLLNRLSLRTQYSLSDHIFVHTERMKAELVSDFGVPKAKVTVIPFGINNTVPNTLLTAAEAKGRLGVRQGDKVLLFFGNIAPYKGLEYLVDAFSRLLEEDPSYLLIIAGRPKGSELYWSQIERSIAESGIDRRVIKRIEYVPDEETELYFKAADLLILPYTHIFQSGVLFLSYSFGLPVIAADVGSLREEIVEGKTGLMFEARNYFHLASTIRAYFRNESQSDLENRRAEITRYANEKYSWDRIITVAMAVYSDLLLHS
ncbi:MAG: glycosyltransferase [Ktedonobacteraceae bacterium]|nr:glycosyltransferase [Ktedonobacteraceae bacterium]